MLAVIGIAVVFLAVFGGFLMEQGNPWVLMQPAELLIVGGAAAGIILVANPPALIRKMLRGSRDAFRPAAYGRQVFLLHLRMLYEVFGYVQRAGIVALEADVENPARSPIFSRYPGFLRDPETRDLVCDSLRMMVIGATTPQELDQLMDLDIDVQRRGRHEPVAALSTVADALPGLGIVAAVLGVVITMQAIGGSPETVGQKVAAALVGTFLGILLCYGLVGPGGGAPGNHRRGAGAIPASAAHRPGGFLPRRVSHPGGGIRAAFHSGGTEAIVPGFGDRDPARRQDTTHPETGRWDTTRGDLSRWSSSRASPNRLNRCKAPAAC